MANEIYENGHVDQCLAAVERIEKEIYDAKTTMFYKDTCIVNREFLVKELQTLKNNLPDTIKKASMIVREENTILQNAAKTRDDTINEANRQANDMMSSAKSQAAQILDQANAQANQWLENAKMMANQHLEATKAQAIQIMEDAQKKANQMVEEETIMVRARAQSEELLANARNDAANTRQKAIEFIDGQLNILDQNLSEMLNQVRLERGDVQMKFHQN